MITRRSLFRSALAALLVPVVAKWPALEPYVPEPVDGEASLNEIALEDILTKMLRNRSGKLADNVLEHNALLRHLSKAGRIE